MSLKALIRGEVGNSRFSLRLSWGEKVSFLFFSFFFFYDVSRERGTVVKPQSLPNIAGCVVGVLRKKPQVLSNNVVNH